MSIEGDDEAILRAPKIETESVASATSDCDTRLIVEPLIDVENCEAVIKLLFDSMLKSLPENMLIWPPAVKAA
jgi:hypothetical protein